MDTFLVILFIILGLGLSGLIFMVAYTYPISKKVYRTQLVRTEPEKWSRVCSAPENEEQLEMWNTGIKWADENREYMTEVEIENDGFKLFGEYFDFGADIGREYRFHPLCPGRLRLCASGQFPLLRYHLQQHCLRC